MDVGAKLLVRDGERARVSEPVSSGWAAPRAARARSESSAGASPGPWASSSLNRAVSPGSRTEPEPREERSVAGTSALQHAERRIAAQSESRAGRATSTRARSRPAERRRRASRGRARRAPAPSARRTSKSFLRQQDRPRSARARSSAPATWPQGPGAATPPAGAAVRPSSTALLGSRSRLPRQGVPAQPLGRERHLREGVRRSRELRASARSARPRARGGPRRTST